MSERKAKTARKRQLTSWAVIDGHPQRIIVPEDRAKRRRARTGAIPLQPTPEQLEAARSRGWGFRYYRPGKGYSERPDVDGWGSAPIGAFTRTVKVEDAAMETVSATTATPKTNTRMQNTATPATPVLANAPSRGDESQELHDVSAGERQKRGGVVSSARLGEPNRGNPTTAASSRSSATPATPALPPLPVLVKADASTALARLSGGFGIAALDEMRGEEYAGLHVEAGDDTEYVERDGERQLLSYQIQIHRGVGRGHRGR